MANTLFLPTASNLPFFKEKRGNLQQTPQKVHPLTDIFKITTACLVNLSPWS